MIFSPLLEGGTTHTAAMIIRLMVLLLLASYLWGAIHVRRLVVPPLTVLPGVAAFLVLAAISVMLSPYRQQSLQWLIVLLSYAALLYVLLCVIETWGQAAQILAVLVLVGLFEAGLALIQAWWFNAPRPSGTFANPNFLAGYLAATWSVLLGSFVHLKIGRNAGNVKVLPVWVAPLFAAGGTVVLLAIILTRSRGGLLALTAGAAVVVVSRFGRKGLAALALVLTLMIVIPNPLSERLRAEHTVNPIGYARWQMWQSAGRQMMDYPLGAGLGLYQYLYPRYAFPTEGQVARYGHVAQTPHSEYVQIGVELGVLALAVFCWGIVRIVREIRAVSAFRLRRWQRGMVVGVSGAWGAILVHAVVDSNLHEPAVAIVLILCTAILFSARRMCQPAASSRTVLIQRPILWGACSVIVLLSAAMLVVRLGVAWLAFEAGSKALANHHLERAVEYYDQAIELDPGKALYHSSKAAAHFQLFQRSRAQDELVIVAEELKQESALNPLSARPFKLMGDVYSLVAAGSAEGDRKESWLRQASVAYEQAVEREPFNPFHRLELGKLYLALAEDGKAERSVRDAVGTEPNFLPGRLWLAVRYAKTNRIKMAKQEYEEILRRQRYYANWSLEAYERSFVSVDVRELAALLEQPHDEKPGKSHALL